MTPEEEKNQLLKYKSSGWEATLGRNGWFHLNCIDKKDAKISITSYDSLYELRKAIDKALEIMELQKRLDEGYKK